MISRLKKISWIIAILGIPVCGIWVVIGEVHKINVIRWRSIDEEWIKNLQTLQVNLTQESFLKLSKDCVQVNSSDLVFYFTLDLSKYVDKYVFVIESYVTNLVLYKGQFRKTIILTQVPYCAKDRYHLDFSEEDVSDILEII